MRQYGVLVAVMSLWLAACGSARQPEEGSTKPACTGCHGDPSRVAAYPLPAAPPVDTRGGTDTTSPGVGAHQQHLSGGAIRGPIACSECHPVPQDTQHAGLPLQFRWGPVASARDVTPSFDATALTCSNYCHGAVLGGGSQTKPVWNVVNGTYNACGTCHGVPPPPPHPAVAATSCRDCHAGTLTADGKIDVAGGLHVNGKVDFGGSGGDCTGCHGDPNRAVGDKRAPPKDTKGNTDTAAAGVGAHQSHLQGGPIRSGVPCTECHVLPTDLQHAGQPLQLTWGPLASTGGVAPAFDANALTCTNYCHGATVPGGSNKTPKWNVVNGSQMACGTCHALPPPAPHPAVGNGVDTTVCNACHGTTVKPDGTIDTAGALHINGKLDFGGNGGDCTGCHGSPDPNRPVAIRPAPPKDTKGNTDTTAPGVGAHQSHLAGGPIRSGLACTDCHPVPTDIQHAGEPLHFSWSPLATGNGATTPSFDANALQCSNYCHGATIAGGTNKSPTWNVVNGSQMACGTCHALPPTSNHPAVGNGTDTTVCNQCHAGTVKSDGTIDTGTGQHVNGRVDFGGSGGDCTGCHGDPNRGTGDKRAPPKDTKGNTDTTAPGVGAHQSHLQGGPIRSPLPCTECHVVPSDIAHAGQPLQLTWGSLARSGGATPTPANGSSFNLTCTNYCHGATIGGGSNKSPTWNVVNGSQMACGTCHGVPPPPPHPNVSGVTSCTRCHSGTVNPDGTINTASNQHINGSLDFSGGGGCTGCHGTEGRQPAQNAPAPPIDLSGSSDTTSPGVGAHQSHLQGGPIRAGIACTECHPYPSDLTHAGQPLQFSWGSLATGNGATTPSFDAGTLRCANYCHGATIAGGSNKSPTWNVVNGSQMACGTCHALPPTSNHPSVGNGSDTTVCNACHATTVDGSGSVITSGGRHINGSVDFGGSGGDCTGCHGDPNRTTGDKRAPPKDTKGNSDTSAPGVGAHQSHLAGGPIRSGLACTDCHPVPADIQHAGEPLHFSWSALATGNGATTPAFDPNTLRCSNYCHGATIAGGSNKSPTWNVVNGSQMACGTCHALPPTSNHPAVGNGSDRTVCNACHATTVDPGGNVITSGGKHINGAVDFGGSGGDCTGCHGDPNRTTGDKRAPPKDTKGNTATSAPGVGAHQSHLAGGPIRSGVPCTECHVVPTDISHAGQPLQLTWGPLATARGASASFDPSNPNAPTCANYCHGTTLSSGSNNRPTWTVVDGSQMACGTCHGLPPVRLSNGGLHFAQLNPGQPITRDDCHLCHSATMNGSNINTSSGTHINGRVEFNAPQ